MLSSTGVKPSTSASGSQPLGNTKKDKIQQTPSSTQKNKVEAHPRTVKYSLKNKNCSVDSKGIANVQHSKLNANFELLCVKGNGCMLSDNHDLCVLDFINNVNARAKPKSVKKSSKRKVVQIVLWYLDSGCSKQMTGDCSQLTNFVNKFLGTVKFGNDHVAKILGYGDYHIGNVTISRVYYVEGLGHNLFSVGQLCDSNLKVAFRQHTCFIRNLKGVDLLTGSRGNNMYTLSLQEMMVSSPMSQVLIERSTSSSLSMITLDLHGRIIETIHVDFDELTAMASKHSNSGPVLHEMTLATISSGIVPNPPPLTLFVPPSRTDWDLLFQALLDELLNPPSSVDRLALEVIAPIKEVVAPEPAASTGSPS
ncbi:hypothetical protein Tco_1113776 [Tanacetum coccineum]|uniref:Retrovirus-related Pol polyprotein from transposon TNT 1-94-like beta-barrel domain-containing protein n=1 Tax=Tanacetum coccineum TaxID=301880 RepID=A0ABQ5IW49_9ASTR